ncbi:MAG: vanadium-dependent haloperoxidase [Gammaproteobacteria bacterium]
MLFDWNTIMTTTVNGQPPPVQNRFAAITQLAVFEAVNAVTGDYKPYLTTIKATPDASAEAAVVAAAHAVLTNYFPDNAASLDAARARSLAAISEGPSKSAGIAVGEAAAAAIIAARANDGSEMPEFHLPSSSRPGEWQLTPGCPPEGGIFVHFRNVTPFGIRSADQFRSDPPPALTSRRYTRDYKEVKAVGALDSTARPQERADVAQFYAVFSDAPLWNTIARQVAAARGKSLSQNARAFALLNMALSDGGVAVLETKYYYNFWRPETAIRDGDRDRNPATDSDISFAPFIVAPCFPSYPSGHATTSYAAREIVERVYGRGPHSITLLVPDVPGVTLKYTRLKDITDDIDDARVYGGIHFRFDQDEAAEQGRRLGAYVYEHNLRRARGSKCDEERG